MPAMPSSLLMLVLVLPPLVAMSTPASAQSAVTATSDYLQRLDTDQDGRVSLDEYLHWMGYAFERMDLDGDGVLQASELPGGRGRPVTRAGHRAALTAGFQRQDLNGDGYLDTRELAAPPPR